ncbi:Dual specificity protein phosphatase 14 [Balamuthia mandrillaris]
MERSQAGTPPPPPPQEKESGEEDQAGPAAGEEWLEELMEPPELIPGTSDDADEIVPGLWLGNSEAGRRADRDGRQAVVCCMAEAENSRHWQQLHDRYRLQQAMDVLLLPMNDGSNGTLHPFVQKGATFIHNQLSEHKRSVLVHCSMGKSRSTSMVAVYLMKHRDMSLRDALTLIRRKRPWAYPLLKFWLELLDLEKEIQADGKESLPRERVARLHAENRSQTPLRTLLSMGFGEASATLALQQHNGDLHAATLSLLSQ